MSFEYLGLSDELLTAVRDAGYDTPTPIQRQAIPAILQGRDVIGIAQTGTGKTASFTLPMIDILSQGRAKARMPRTLILEPTRELAAQVAESFEKYGKHSKLSMALLIGGVSFGDQESKLERGVDVLIATPGRLMDHATRGNVMLNGVQVLVVDECDRMLDMGFIPDVENICQKIPQAHQTLFFSATLSKEIKRLTDKFLNDPKLIEVAPPASTAATVSQSIAIVGAREKSKALRELIASDDIDSAIVFCNRKVEVKSVYTSLKRAGLAVGQLHGDMAQPDRMDTLTRFKSGDVRILVASDVAARGLDIPSVSHVFNYDVPRNSEDYVHRIGRTGRAGRKGCSVTLAMPSDTKAVLEIEALIGRPIDRQPLKEVKTRELESDEEAPKKSGSRPARKPRGKAAQAKTQSTNSEEKTDATAKEDAPSESAATKQQTKAAPQKQSRSRSKPKEAEKSEDKKAKDRSTDDRKSRSNTSTGNRRNNNGNGRHHHEDDTPVVGMGSHVPAFLMRPVPKRG
ncbi:DEAD/DEAH box helicase [Iodidimonas muriae]|uniref:DEAD/DEAH box helicase n=1 Tax=Iodidimonas muriae TaxID=261467 RepID=A0ABQ2LE81_9PROT|nr:DEAD/DEAH box helicase [Iodidimonas muriae]GGO13168.1 DEAD/DEAH box helicase [Iodidimonas muriae]